MATSEQTIQTRRGDGCRGLRVSIVGGSIGGLAAAIALHKAGAHVKVFERRTVMQDEGAGIGLRPFGVAGLSRLGVKVSEPLKWSWRYGSVRNGNVRVRVEWKTALTPYTYTKLRGALLETAADIDYKANTRVTGIDQTSDTARVRLGDGTEIESDLVISADGVDSNTRSLLFPEVSVQDTGVILLRGFVSEASMKDVFPPSVLAKFDQGNTQLFATSVRGGWWLGHLLPQLAKDAGRIFQWIYYLPTTSEERDVFLTDSDGIRQRWGTRREQTSSAAKEKLRDAFESYFPKQIAPLANIGAITAHRCSKLVVPTMAVGRVCLVGDAAHVTPPWGVGGSSLAIADGVSLAEQLEVASSVKSGVAGWSAERMAEIRKMLAQVNKIQEHTLTRRPDLATATGDEIDAWIRSFLPPGAQEDVRVFGSEEQAQIFEP